MSDYIAPEGSINSYTCPYCGVNTTVKESNPLYPFGRDPNAYPTKVNPIVFMHQCGNAKCQNIIVWFKDYPNQSFWGRYDYPDVKPYPLQEDAIPEDVKDIYEEARAVYGVSKRSSAILLRLALDKLLDFIDDSLKTERNIKVKIEKYLETKQNYMIAQAMDNIRLIGNGNAHDITDIIETVSDEDIDNLFVFFNIIIHNIITMEKMVKEMHNKMPDRKKITEASSA